MYERSKNESAARDDWLSDVRPEPVRASYLSRSMVLASAPSGKRLGAVREAPKQNVLPAEQVAKLGHLFGRIGPGHSLAQKKSNHPFGPGSVGRL